MELNLKNKNIVVIGGCGLIGRFFCESILKHGGIPLVIDSDSKSVHRMKIDLEANGQDIEIFNFDVTKRTNWDQFSSVMPSDFQIDGIVYCAAINPKVQGSTKWVNQLVDMDEVEWTQGFQVGVLGIINSVLACLPAMKNAKGSSVVLMGSDLSFISPDNRLYCVCPEGDSQFSSHDCPTKPMHYSFIKSGLIGLTKNLASMLASYSIHVNILCPGTILEDSMPNSFVSKVSKRIPLGRPGNLSELELPLIFLLNAHYSYMTGQSLIIDGGRTIL